MKKLELIPSRIEVPMITTSFPECLTENKVNYKFSHNFKAYVLNASKKVSSLLNMSFDIYEFIKIIYDEEIMEHFQISDSSGLMTREEILWTIANLTSKQPKGREGFLKTDGESTIIGYMLCDDGVVRIVSIFWNYFSGAEWHCSCGDLGHWNVGNQMLLFSKN